MTHNSGLIEASDLDEWRRALGDIAMATALADNASGCRYAADLAAVLASHPQGLFSDLAQQVAAFAVAGADASAALALVEPLASFMLSGAPGGRHLATVVLAGQTVEHHAEGANAALALMGALAMALAGSDDLAAGPQAPTGEARLVRIH